MKNKSKKVAPKKPLNKGDVLSSAVQLPPNVYIGKEKTNGLMIGGRPVFSAVAQIFLQCNGKEKKCHDTIALLPKRNANRDANGIVDSISNEMACKIFDSEGWLVKGYNNSKYTRCPVCSKKMSIRRTKVSIA